jgi:predicted porin
MPSTKPGGGPQSRSPPGSRFPPPTAAGVSGTLGEKWILFADAGFTFIGKPAGFNLRNQWNYDVGLGYYFTKALTLSLYYEEYRAAVQGNQNPQDLLFSLNYDWSSRMSLNASVQIGLSDGAPDYALGAGISLKY